MYSALIVALTEINLQPYDYNLWRKPVGEGWFRGSGGRKSPSGVQGRIPGRVSGGRRSSPEAEAFCYNESKILTFPGIKFFLSQ